MQPRRPATATLGPPPGAGGRRLGHVLGVPVRVHPSVLATLAALWAWGYVGFGPDGAGLDGRDAAVVGGALAVAFYASVFVHELAHALVARRLGQPVSMISLSLLGGTTRLERPAPSPRTEFTVALVGPLANLTVAGLLLVISETWAPSAPLAAAVVGLLGELNALVAVFNLVPVHPLDGGVLLRATLWHVRGDRSSAGRATAALGMALGVVLLVGGLGLGLVAEPEIAAVGLWGAFIGLFVAVAGHQARKGARIHSRLDGMVVRDLTDEAPWIGEPGWTVGRVLAEVARHDVPGLVVDGERIVGWFGSEQLADVPTSRYDLVTLSETAEPIASTIDAAAPLTDVLSHLERRADVVLGVTAVDGPLGLLPGARMQRLLLGQPDG